MTRHGVGGVGGDPHVYRFVCRRDWSDWEEHPVSAVCLFCEKQAETIEKLCVHMKVRCVCSSEVCSVVTGKPIIAASSRYTPSPSSAPHSSESRRLGAVGWAWAAAERGVADHSLPPPLRCS